MSMDCFRTESRTSVSKSSLIFDSIFHGMILLLLAYNGFDVNVFRNSLRFAKNSFGSNWLLEVLKSIALPLSAVGVSEKM